MPEAPRLLVLPASGAPRVKPPVPTERQVQAAVVDLFRQLGGRVCSLSQGYRPGGPRHGTTRQTKGLADLRVFFPARGVCADFEVKRPGGKVTPEQMEYGCLCESCGHPWACGGVSEAVELLRRLGFKVLPKVRSSDG